MATRALDADLFLPTAITALDSNLMAYPHDKLLLLNAVTALGSDRTTNSLARRPTNLTTEARLTRSNCMCLVQVFSHMRMTSRKFIQLRMAITADTRTCCPLDGSRTEAGRSWHSTATGRGED
jgi:hypothetical protein